jgi:hypothetical protein
VKYAVESASCGVVLIPSFMTIVSGIHKILSHVKVTLDGVLD